jgi:hypothetical protein
VPRIPDHYLQCVFYVYGSKAAAEAGVRFGGSGFLVSVPSLHDGIIHVYAVTNQHVLDKGFHVLRLNTRDGKSDVIETSPSDWTPHPEGDDIAAIAINVPGHLRWWPVQISEFIAPGLVRNYVVGPGDETFLVGRLVTLEGRQKNTPIVLRQPAGSAIYFAVDFDASSAQLANEIGAYFQAVKEGFTTASAPYTIGVYGSGLTCRTISASGAASYTWLAGSTGWREYQLFRPSATLVQSAPSRKICNGKLDVDDNVAQSADFGGFRLPIP